VDNVDNIQQTSFLQDVNCEQIVIKKTKRRKKIEINLDGMIMELNWLLLPLAPIGKERDVGTIIVKWKDGKNKLRGIKISMTDGYNMLTRFDIKVLAALQKLYSEQNKVIEYNYDKKEYNMPIEINYTISKISKILRYKSCGGSAGTKIKQSIRKLANCTITSLYTGGIYDANNKKYIESQEKGFHIIEEYDMYEYSELSEGKIRLSPRKIKEYNKVTINKFFLQNMKTGYFRIISLDMLMSLKQDVSQRLFTLFEGWYCDKKPYVYFNYTTLYERIPLNPISVEEKPMPNKEKNRYIRNACKELIERKYMNGFLSDKKGIYCIFEDIKGGENAYKEYIKEAQKDYYGLNKYNEKEEIIATLLNVGFDENEVDTYVKQDRMEYIKALLRLFDIKLRHDSIRENIKGFLIRGMKPPYYNIDKKYFN